VTEAPGIPVFPQSAYPVLTMRARMLAAVASGLLAAAALVHFGFTSRGVIEAIFVSVLPPLAAIDIDRRVLPNRIVLPTLALVLVAQCAFFPGRAPEWIGATAGAAAFLLIPAIFYRGGIGMGDVKLAALLGAALGRHVPTALLVTSFSLLPVTLVILARHGSDARKMALPFGPFLALGGAVAMLLM
jgi:leader peptidase (prepilin peptidase) / N-methyltransferase